MSRYIDADKLKKEGWHLVRERRDKRNLYTEGMDLDCVPTAEEQHGKWIEHEWAEEVEGLFISNYECSECHMWERNESDYCPNCGTKMDEVEE